MAEHIWPALSRKHFLEHVYSNHPYALGPFESPPSTNDPGLVDLGLWNVFANSDFPAPQPGWPQIAPLLIPGGLSDGRQYPVPNQDVAIVGATGVMVGVNLNEQSFAQTRARCAILHITSIVDSLPPAPRRRQAAKSGSPLAFPKTARRATNQWH